MIPTKKRFRAAEDLSPESPVERSCSLVPAHTAKGLGAQSLAVWAKGGRVVLRVWGVEVRAGAGARACSLGCKGVEVWTHTSGV